jgi:hypothetical protein
VRARGVEVEGGECERRVVHGVQRDKYEHCDVNDKGGDERQASVRVSGALNASQHCSEELTGSVIMGREKRK